MIPESTALQLEEFNRLLQRLYHDDPATFWIIFNVVYEWLIATKSAHNGLLLLRLLVQRGDSTAWDTLDNMTLERVDALVTWMEHSIKGFPPQRSDEEILAKI